MPIDARTSRHLRWPAAGESSGSGSGIHALHRSKARDARPLNSEQGTGTESENAALRGGAMSFAIEHLRGVVTITLDRPRRLNALTFEVYRELAEWFEQQDRDDAVRAIVITGRGRGFCSGGDQDDIIHHL